MNTTYFLWAGLSSLTNFIHHRIAQKPAPKSDRERYLSNCTSLAELEARDKQWDRSYGTGFTGTFF